jgi:diadenosine tetraphosphatase ApaH/serine/threonine PP2A family protein phosphatase
MRVAIFSDIHSNLAALETVLAAYRDLDVERYVCLGDVVGYGPFPQECCELVRPLVATCIIGNHDAAVAGRLDYAYYYDAARTALDHHQAQLSRDNLEWLRSLPYMERWQGYCFCHGSPINAEAFDYVFNPSQAFGLLRHFEALARVTFIGHSHLTKSFALDPESDYPVEEIEGDVLHFGDGRKYIVTVGSVGQPRDGDARACFTVLDTEADTLEFHRAEYEVTRTVRAVLADPKLSPDFGKRLLLGI